MALQSRKLSSKGEKILLYTLGILFVFALCYFFIISPSSDKNKPIKDDIAKVQKQLVEVQNIDNEIENKKNQLEKLEEKYNESSKELPKTDRYPQIFKDEEDLAKECGLDSIKGQFADPEVVKSVTNNVSKDNTDNSNKEFTGMKSMAVTYKVVGTFDATMKFIDKLENASRIADIVEVKQRESQFEVTAIYYASGGETDEKEEYDFN